MFKSLLYHLSFQAREKSVTALPRRFCYCLWLLIFLCIAFSFPGFIYNAWFSIPSPPRSWRIPFTTDDGILLFGANPNTEKEPLRIAIVETGGTHDEVTAALVHAFGSQESTELSVYVEHWRYNMGDIVGKFNLVAPITFNYPSKSFVAATEESLPDILVSTTCELDLDRLAGPIRAILANGTTHIFCVIHHADRWTEGRHVNVAREYLEQGRLDFIALSQHTGDFLLNETVSTWDSNASVRAWTFPPVFPVDLPESDAADSLSLAMQGDYSSERRDYQSIYEHLGSVIRKVNESALNTEEKEKVSLHVIGHGTPPKVPEAVRDHVIFDQDLSYHEFYAVLSRSFSILAAFASDTYFDRKASSTVPASLMAGVPIVASEKLLAAYSYLPRDAAWVSKPGESEMDVILRVIGDRDEYIRKREYTKATRTRLIEGNRAHVKQWIAEALKNVDGKD